MYLDTQNSQRVVELHDLLSKSCVMSLKKQNWQLSNINFVSATELKIAFIRLAKTKLWSFICPSKLVKIPI